MRNLLFSLLCCFFVAQNLSFAQNSEGFIKLKSVNEKNKTEIVTWYFKGDKLASEVEMFDNEGKSVNIKAVFDLPAQTIFVSVPNFSQAFATKINTIPLNPLFADGIQYSEIGRNSKDDRFKQVVDAQMKHGEYTTIPKYTTDIPFNWALYKDFLKQDPTFYTMTQQGLKGFPFYAVTQDKEGKIISQFQLIEFKFTRVEDKVFQK